MEFAPASSATKTGRGHIALVARWFGDRGRRHAGPDPDQSRRPRPSLKGRPPTALGRWDEALAAFDTAIKRAPTSAVPRYNAAATLFQLGRYDLARDRYREARERAGSFLRTKIDFALGNTALAEGDIAGAIRSYDDCVASTARGAALEAVRRDAAINRRFALEQQQSLSAPRDENPGDESQITEFAAAETS